MALEKTLVNHIIKQIRAAFPQAWILKTHGGGMQRTGIPDLVICVEGFFVGLEVKQRKAGESEQAARARATPLQRAEIEKIEQAGGLAEVVLSSAEALAVIERGFKKLEKTSPTD